MQTSNVPNHLSLDLFLFILFKSFYIQPVLNWDTSQSLTCETKSDPAVLLVMCNLASCSSFDFFLTRNNSITASFCSSLDRDDSPKSKPSFLMLASDVKG